MFYNFPVLYKCHVWIEAKQKQFTVEEKSNVIFFLKEEDNSDVANELGGGHCTVSKASKVSYGKLETK